MITRYARFFLNYARLWLTKFFIEILKANLIAKHINGFIKIKVPAINTVFMNSARLPNIHVFFSFDRI